MVSALESYLDQMRRSGALRAFNDEYKRRREDANAQGHGYMSYRAAMARLRDAVVKQALARQAGTTRSLFNDVFNVQAPENKKQKAHDAIMQPVRRTDHH